MPDFVFKLCVFLCGIVIGYWLLDTFDPGVVTGQRVLITGASSGIGEQLAYQYAKYGANIVITARSENKLKEVVDRCRQLGKKDQIFSYVVADMSQLNTTEHVVQSAARILGDLDVVILNHVIYLSLGVWTGSKEDLSDFKKAMTVNVDSYVHLASHALPYLEKTNGSLTVVNSLAGKLSTAYFASYSTSKFAIDGFFRALRLELQIRDSGVTVTQCVLGLVDTPNVINAWDKFLSKPMKEVHTAEAPENAAFAILKASATRVRELVFPLKYQPYLMLSRFVPDTFEIVNKYLYKTFVES